MVLSISIGKPIYLYRSYRIYDIGKPTQNSGGEKNMCGIYHGRHHGRQFLTTEEKIERLEEYKNWLDNESKGVEETIEKLKKAS